MANNRQQEQLRRERDRRRQAHEPANDAAYMMHVQSGRLLAELMLQASAASGISDLSKIQFNFCLQTAEGTPLVSSRESIRECLQEYRSYLISHDPAGFQSFTDRFSNLEELSKSFPVDPATLHNYQDTLKLRGESFQEAAQLILKNAGIDDITAVQDKLNELKKTFDNELGKPGSPEEQQARYDGYMNALAGVLMDATGKDEKEINKNLKEAETIVNIKQNKAHVTISGKVNDKNGILCSDNIHLQIDEPRNRFSDFSSKQQAEWMKVYQEFQQNGANAKYPKWFEKRTDIEKKIWIGKMAEVAAGNKDVNMGPVVKKQGFPGLRNLALTSFATVTVSPSGTATIKEVSAKSVRSSNLVSQAKDGTRRLNGDQKKLTQQNIQQVSETYQKNNMGQPTGGFTYENTNRKPFVLCQTLVRKVGGGDDHVIKHKNAAIKAVNKAENSNRVFGSNHCIGTPAKVSKAFHWVMHKAGTNTRGMDHITAPVKEYMEDGVIKSVANPLLQQELRDLSDAALKGKYPGKDKVAEVAKACGFDDKQSKSLDRVLQATSMYANETGTKSSYQKTHQFHMAALEEIIYQDTGNCVQSSCKSGKDREGAKLNYRNAMQAFYAETGRLPPSTNKNEEFPGDREKFVKIFVELFKTHHQARLAELNAKGCEGQKALANILPKDIAQELKKDDAGRHLLEMHKQNSALNDMGKSKIKADPAELEKVTKDTYSSFAATSKPAVSMVRS